MKTLNLIVENVSPTELKRDVADKRGVDYDWVHEHAQKKLTGDISHIGREGKSAISRWTQNSPVGYKEINSHLRNGDGDEETKNIAGHLAAAVAGHSLPNETWGYRGIHGPHATALNRLKAGDTFHNSGFASMTLDPHRATHFARGKDILVTHVPKGTKALYVSHPNLNGWTAERELLLNHGTHFKYSHSEDVKMPEHHYSGQPTGKMASYRLHHVEVIPPSKTSIAIDK